MITTDIKKDYNSENNIRIARNSLVLYVRMFVIVLVSLYTSRVLLRTLGVVDYGIFSVVGGVVTILSFLNGSMSSSTQRYLNVDIAHNDLNKLKNTFRTAVQLHICIALVIFLLAETIGLWFVYTKIVLPDSRLFAALCVYHFSVISCVINIICLPYSAAIIAHEKMDAFAYISIFDTFLKLIIVYLIIISPWDKLIFFSALYVIVGLIDRVIYHIYCTRHFEEVKGVSLKCLDLKLFKEMSGFAGWSLWGNLAGVLFTEGINILLNLFFGPVINAARGIAVQVQGVFQGFIGNIQVAVNPQITKSYAQGNLQRMRNLMVISSKFCFFLLYLLVLPALLETDKILHIWLGEVPQHTVWFLRLILLVMLTDTLANPYVIANQATGKVKKYQILCGGMMLLIVPIAYIVLKLGAKPESVFIVHGVIAVLTQIVRIYLMRSEIKFPVDAYIRRILNPVIGVAVISFIFPYIAYLILPNNMYVFFVICFLSIVSVVSSVYFIGINKTEKSFLRGMISNIITR